MVETFADRVISFNERIDFKGNLPPGISIMNPFKENKEVLKISNIFYKKFYDDHEKRHLILGINPGRFGGAVTGIPFTDTKRLTSECGIPYQGKETHEPSSVFVYEMIKAYGGTGNFYRNFYINSICPLGFTATNDKGKEVNYNYYDSAVLIDSMYEFMVENIQTQVCMGIYTDTCFCFGNGKNERFLRKLNEKYQFFQHIIALEHPRFIMQYKAKTKQLYLDKYLQAFRNVV